MTSLAFEWGLSLRLESHCAGAKAQDMLDFGYTPEIVLRNADLLDIDPAKIDGQHRARMRSDLCFYNGGEEGFREKFLGDPKDPISWGSVDRQMLTAQHVTPVCCHEPHDLSQAFTTGYIERSSFEQVSGGSMVYEYDHFTETERRGKLLKDTHPDEHATCYVVQGRGLVVISSCGHVGLINTIKQAMAVSGVSKLHAVIGGFHLVTAPQDYIDQTVTELEALEPDPHALLRRRLYRHHAPAHAAPAGDDQRRHPLHVRRVTRPPGLVHPSRHIAPPSCWNWEKRE